MHLYRSEMDIGMLLFAASEGKLQGYENVELQVCYVPPGWSIEVFDRLLDKELDDRYFVRAEYAGEVPVIAGDGRRYTKRFRHLERYTDSLVTFASSYYQLQPVSAILQSRRDADSEGYSALSFKLFICDTDTRIGIMALLAEDLNALEEEDEKEVPVSLSERVASRSS